RRAFPHGHAVEETVPEERREDQRVVLVPVGHRVGVPGQELEKDRAAGPGKAADVDRPLDRDAGELVGHHPGFEVPEPDPQALPAADETAQGIDPAGDLKGIVVRFGGNHRTGPRTELERRVPWPLHSMRNPTLMATEPASKEAKNTASQPRIQDGPK